MLYKEGNVNPIILTETESLIFEALKEKKGEVVMKKTLMKAIYGDVPFPDAINSRIVDVYIGYLRNKLGYKSIKTVRGFGYSYTGRGVIEN